jgi:hypothetical protein
VGCGSVVGAVTRCELHDPEPTQPRIQRGIFKNCQFLHSAGNCGP